MSTYKVHEVKILIFLSLQFFVLTSTNGQGNQSNYKVAFDTIKGRALLKQCSRSVPGNISGYWALTPSNIGDLEKNLTRIEGIKSVNGQRISSVDKYGFQYVGVVIKNKKYIYLNAFRIYDDNDLFHKNWETEPLIMCDGGDYNWGVLYNVKTRKFSQLSINGII